MNRTRLIQRLGQPTGFDNPFSFGGGLENGGISPEGMDVIRDVFSFEYMGAAEFEMGVIPNVLSEIWAHAQKGNLATDDHNGVYYIAPIEYEQGERSLIDSLLKDESSLNLTEYVGLADAMLHEEVSTAGWHELENGFFMFKDQEIFEGTKQIFHI